MALPIQQNTLPEPFITSVTYLDGNSCTGQTLTEPYLAADGKLQVIFENLVLYFDTSSSAQVFALPITEKVGIQPEHLVGRIDDSRMTFFIIQVDKGHNVPIIFNDYIARHGGLDIFGIPVLEIVQLREKIFRQCFENLCLFYVHQAPADLKIRSINLGINYFNRYYNFSHVAGDDVFLSNPQILLTIWETDPKLVSD